ncbi:MAG: glycosyltransferase, partial [Anaerolineales bacterium]
MLIAIIPSFNEERFIGSVVLRAKKYVDTVMVVDDGSTDSTA